MKESKIGSALGAKEHHHRNRLPNVDEPVEVPAGRTDRRLLAFLLKSRRLVICVGNFELVFVKRETNFAAHIYICSQQSSPECNWCMWLNQTPDFLLSYFNHDCSPLDE